MDDERLASIPLLAVLNKGAGEQVLRTAREAHYGAGQTVVREGDPATVLYLIVSGHAGVEHEGRVIASIGPGEFFGELALIEEHPQMAIPMLSAIIAPLHRSEHHG